MLHVEAESEWVVASQGVGLVTGSDSRNGAARVRVIAERRLDGALRLHVVMVLLGRTRLLPILLLVQLVTLVAQLVLLLLLLMVRLLLLVVLIGAIGAALERLASLVQLLVLVLRRGAVRLVSRAAEVLLVLLRSSVVVR